MNVDPKLLNLPCIFTIDELSLIILDNLFSTKNKEKKNHIVLYCISGESIHLFFHNKEIPNYCRLDYRYNLKNKLNKRENKQKVNLYRMYYHFYHHLLPFPTH